jgi:hypothetical protein
MDIFQRTHILLKTADILYPSLSIPRWDVFSDPESSARKGFVRHGGVPRAKDFCPSECKLPYQEHLKRYLIERGDPEGSAPRPILGFGTRNSIQNLFLPVFHGSRQPAVLARVDEPLQDTVYQAFCVFRNGDAFWFAIERLRFIQSEAGGWDAKLLGATHSEPDLEFAIVGQPILFDGEVTPLHLLAACTYDLRHIWAPLRWEDWQRCDSERELHNKMMDVLMSKLTAPIRDRAAALAQIATQAGLAVSDGYLHSSLGISRDGSTLHLLMMNGSLEEIGKAQKALGADRAILLDNGGSVGAAYWSLRVWAEVIRQSQPVPPPVFIGNNSYFRPRGHALVLLELKSDFTEVPFRERAPGDTAWRAPTRQA